MGTRKIRVMVVDDSSVIRQMICDFVSEAPDMEVVGVAPNGAAAVESYGTILPDVVTLDIQMPGMDGLAVLEAMMARRPVVVIMVSALTQVGAAITLDALDRGALDYVAKPESRAETEAVLRDDLLRKIRTMAGADVKRIMEIRAKRAESRKLRDTNRRQHVPPLEVTTLADKCIALGISTGGPPALTCLFESLAPPMPPIVVVQHMPPHFTKPLAWRLDSLSKLTIREATDGDVLRPNHVLIAPGGHHLELKRYGSHVKALIRDGDPVSGHKPSVDVMMTGAAKAFGANCMGVVMTGMGRDGSHGCRAIRTGGGYVLGQDEATSDVYGMNKVAFQEGNVDRQFALHEAATVLTQQVRRLWGRGAVLSK